MKMNFNEDSSGGNSHCSLSLQNAETVPKLNTWKMGRITW